jgi:hypothetical protein
MSSDMEANSGDLSVQVSQQFNSMLMRTCFRLFLLTNCKTRVEEQQINQASFTERVSHIKTFLFQNNKTAFDQRFYRVNEQNFSKPQWDVLLKLFANDVTNSSPFLPSMNETALLTIGLYFKFVIFIFKFSEELNKIRNEVQSAQNSYYNANNRQHYERKEREHLRVSCLLSLLEQLDRSVLERFYSADLQKVAIKNCRKTEVLRYIRF